MRAEEENAWLQAQLMERKRENGFMRQQLQAIARLAAESSTRQGPEGNATVAAVVEQDEVGTKCRGKGHLWCFPFLFLSEMWNILLAMTALQLLPCGAILAFDLHLDSWSSVCRLLTSSPRLEILLRVEFLSPLSAQTVSDVD